MNKIFEVKNLKYKYPKNDDYTVKDISFEINEGEIFGFLGPSGAGKSTTQKILVKLLKKFEGEILYLGKPLNEYNDSFYEEIGVSFEMPISFSKLTAMENLEFFKKLYKSTIEVEPLLKRVGLWEDRDKNVGEFSKGMKIRLNFVRAMINNPKMLFLDEFTGGLDPKNAKIMRDLILEYKQNGGTVFLTTHIMADVDALCDRVAFIADGKIQEMAVTRDLKIKHGKRVVTLEYREDGNLLTEEFDFDMIKSEEFMKFVKNNEIETIHSGETTLEEIFIKVTGVGLRE